ncbi:MAG TPA: hypothetical protein VK866_13725 [Acidimicrobiales bacterium]|nr:hypothetical protein [Acidimicrobiales bacterium]
MISATTQRRLLTGDSPTVTTTTERDPSLLDRGDDLTDLAAIRSGESTPIGGSGRTAIDHEMDDRDGLLDTITAADEQRAAARQESRDSEPAAGAGTGAWSAAAPGRPGGAGADTVEYPVPTGATWTEPGPPPKEYEIFQLEDGSVAALDDDGDVVRVLVDPPYTGDYPRPIGQLWDSSTGQPRDAYATENGSVVFLDEDGDVDRFYHDSRTTVTRPEIDHETGEFTWETYEQRPNEQYGWDLYDMESGELVETGSPGIPMYHPLYGDIIVSSPLGHSETYIVDAETGEILDVWPPAGPEPTWEFLFFSGGNGTGFTADFGFVEGNVTINEDGFSASAGVDLGFFEAEGSMYVGKDGFGVEASFELDGVASGSMGLNIGDDGWDFAASASVAIPGVGRVEGSTSFGSDDGKAFFDLDASAQLQLGKFQVGGELAVAFQETDDGLVFDAAVAARVGAFGAYVEGGFSVNYTEDADGASASMGMRAAAGHDALGEVGVSTSWGLDVGNDGTLSGRFGVGADAHSDRWGSVEAGVEWSQSVDADGEWSSDTRTWAESSPPGDDTDEVDHGSFTERFGPLGSGEPDDGDGDQGPDPSGPLGPGRDTELTARQARRLAERAEKEGSAPAERAEPPEGLDLGPKLPGEAGVAPGTMGGLIADPLVDDVTSLPTRPAFDERVSLRLDPADGADGEVADLRGDPPEPADDATDADDSPAGLVGERADLLGAHLGAERSPGLVSADPVGDLGSGDPVAGVAGLDVSVDPVGTSPGPGDRVPPPDDGPLDDGLLNS